MTTNIDGYYNPHTDIYGGMSRHEWEGRMNYEKEQMRRMNAMQNPYANQHANQCFTGAFTQMQEKQVATPVKKHPEFPSGMNPLLLLTGE